MWPNVPPAVIFKNVLFCVCVFKTNLITKTIPININRLIVVMDVKHVIIYVRKLISKYQV